MPEEKQSKEENEKNIDTPSCDKQEGSIRCFLRRSFLITMETIAVIVFILVIIVGLAIMRLVSGPIDMDFAKEYIEKSLSYDDKGYSLSYESAVIGLPSIKSSLILEIKDVLILKDNNPVIAIETVALDISRSSLLAGKIHPSAILLKGPDIRLIRNDKFHFNIDIDNSLIKNAPEISTRNETAIIERIIDNLINPQNIDENSPLKKLQRFEIRNAKAIVSDEYMGFSWPIENLDVVFTKIDNGLSIKSKLKLPTRHDADNSYLEIDAEYNRISGDYSIGTNVTDLDIILLAGSILNIDNVKDQNIYINGNISTLVSSDYKIKELTANLNSETGRIKNSDLWDEYKEFNNLNVDISYINDDGKEQLDIKDISFEIAGITPIISSLITSDDNNGYEADLNIKMLNSNYSDITDLAPKSMNGSPAEEWLVKRLSNGTFTEIGLGFLLSIDKLGDNEYLASFFDNYKISLDDTKVNFSFKDMSAKYSDTLSIAHKVKGSGKYEDGDLVINIDHAEVIGMPVEKASIIITKLGDKNEEGKINVDIEMKNAPLKSLYKYILDKPINIAKKLDTDISKMSGKADLTINIEFPDKKNLKVEEINVIVNADLNNVHIPKLVRGMDIKNGKMNLKVDLFANEIKISGKSKLLGQNLKFDWFGYIDPKGKKYKTKFTAKLDTNDEIRKNFGLELDNITGIIPAEVTYKEYTKHKSEAKIKADITNSFFSIPQFDYKKAKGESGSVDLVAKMYKSKIREIKNLNVTAKNLDINNVYIKFGRNSGEIESGSIPKSKIARNIFKADFKSDKEGKLKIIADAVSFDLRSFLNNSPKVNNGGIGAGIIISLKAKDMITAEGRTIKDVQIYFDKSLDGTINQLEMDAVAGKGDIYLRYKPDKEGRLAFRLEADDAGATLYAFNIFDDIKGGKIVAYAVPEGGAYKGDLEGEAFLYDFRLVNAPDLANLLSLMSLAGIGNILDGEGLAFTKLETEFRWHFRKDGDLLAFKEGRTSGNALGLTFEGNYDSGKNTVDINGTIVPMSLINSFISNIPIIGHILTGGSGGVFAATYEIKGDAQNPKSSINPLSVLAPGIIRKIIFED